MGHTWCQYQLFVSYDKILYSSYIVNLKQTIFTMKLSGNIFGFAHLVLCFHDNSFILFGIEFAIHQCTFMSCRFLQICILLQRRVPWRLFWRWACDSVQLVLLDKSYGHTEYRHYVHLILRRPTWAPYFRDHLCKYAYIICEVMFNYRIW